MSARRRCGTAPAAGTRPARARSRSSRTAIRRASPRASAAPASPSRTGRSADVHGGFVEVDGTRVHHVHGGRGSPPVLFVHGLGSAGYLEWPFTLPVISPSHPLFPPDLPALAPP